MSQQATIPSDRGPMRPRALVVGAAGQLGTELRLRPGSHEVIGLTRDQLDITDADAVRRTVAAVSPSVVVNAAAWTAVDDCEHDPARAMRVNADGPRNLALACAATDATLVQLSTDYVFPDEPPRGEDGAPRPWREDDPTGPLSVYGRSKLAGERAALEAHDRVHVVRTAWVASAHGGNFVRTMLRLADGGGPVRVVDDQHGSPTFTPDLADRIWRIVEHGEATRSFGTWHATNDGSCSWFGLAAATFELAGLEVELSPQPSSALDRAAPRPSWSVLGDTRGAALGWPPMPHWREGLARLLVALGRR